MNSLHLPFLKKTSNKKKQTSTSNIYQHPSTLSCLNFPFFDTGELQKHSKTTWLRRVRRWSPDLRSHTEHPQNCWHIPKSPGRDSGPQVDTVVVIPPRTHLRLLGPVHCRTWAWLMGTFLGDLTLIKFNSTSWSLQNLESLDFLTSSNTKIMTLKSKHIKCLHLGLIIWSHNCTPINPWSRQTSKPFPDL